MRVCSIGLLAACLAALPASAQQAPSHGPGPIRFSHQGEEALNQTFVIYQDHEGFMWFAVFSSGRIYRYDGHDYQTFVPDPTRAGSPLPGMPYAMIEDRDSVLWVAKASGLSRFDRDTERFQSWVHDDSAQASISPGAVFGMLDDSDGNFWVATGSGLDRMDRETGTFEHFRARPDSLLHFENQVRSIAEDREGRLWLGGWGLMLFDRESRRFRRYLPNPSVVAPRADRYASFNGVQAVHVDPEGRLLVGTVGDGLYRFDPSTETFTSLRETTEAGFTYAVTWFADDPRSGLWFGTSSFGLQWIDPGTGESRSYASEPWIEASPSGSNITSLHRDRSGQIWLGSWWRDVDRFDRVAGSFSSFTETPGGNRGLYRGHVNTIAEAPDGTVWLTTGGAGVDERTSLTQLDPDTETVRHITQGLPALSKVRPIAVDRLNAVWIGGDGDVIRMDPGQAGRFRHFRHDPERDDSIPAGPVNIIHEDRAGRLWFWSQGFGLSRLVDAASGRFERIPLSADLVRANSLFERTDGRFWITMNPYLLLFDPATGISEKHLDGARRPLQIGDDVGYIGVWERSEEPGVVWLGASPYGLGRFEPATGTFRLYTTADGLPDNGAQGVLGDEEGRLWIATDIGISRFDPDTGEFVNYDTDDGLQGKSFNSWAFHKGRSGRMYFGGPNGLNAFFPPEIWDNPHPPLLALTTLRVGRNEVKPGPGSPLERRLNATRDLTLRHDQNDITLEFVGLHFRNAARNLYTHILEGHDDTWSDTSFARTATYTNLEPGSYTFRFSSANSDGVWNPEPKTLVITILSPWWRTWWAYLIYLGLAVAATVQGYRWQHARVVQREREAVRDRELAQAREIERQHTELTRTHSDLESAHATLKSTQAQLVQSEKLASLGQLTSGIAHELKNPLNFVNNFAEVNEELARDLIDEIKTDPRRTLAEASEPLTDLAHSLKANSVQIAKHGKRADAIVANMMAHAATGSGERLEVGLNAFVEEYVKLANGAFVARRPELNARIERDFDPAASTVSMAPQELGRALLNVLTNALDAVHARARVETVSSATGLIFVPTVTVSTRRLDRVVEIRIADNGPGIPPDILTKIFEPFFTTKPTGEGTGLGLSLAHDIVVQGHGGKLEARNLPEGGAEFLISMPV